MSLPPPSPVRRQLEFLKRQSLLIAVVTAAAIGVAGAIVVTQNNVYRASTKIVVGQGGGVFQPQFGNVVQPFTQTMSSLLKSDIVARTAIRNLKLDETPSSLLGQIHISNSPDSAVLQVNLDSGSQADAVGTLREVTAVFISLARQRLEQPVQPVKGQAQQPVVTATVFDPPHAAGQISPRPARTLAFAGILGLALGFLLGWIREALDERTAGRTGVDDRIGAPEPSEQIYRREDARQPFGAPALATLARRMLGSEARSGSDEPAVPATTLRRERSPGSWSLKPRPAQPVVDTESLEPSAREVSALDSGADDDGRSGR